jgi:hypothetical protein
MYHYMFVDSKKSGKPSDNMRLDYSLTIAEGQFLLLINPIGLFS